MFKKSINSCICFPLILSLLFITGCKQNKQTTSREGSVPASEALATFQLEPGFQIELLASEPIIASPVDMEIDEYGRLYVVEMPGYPLDNSRTGRIRLLSDTDGDGVMDKSVLFAEDLMLPNGIMRWKNGVIVTDAPDVLYLEDSDGDGKADIRKTILTGFSLSNPHVNVNNPIYGLDNWIHLSHLGAIGTRKYGTEFGDKGGEVFYPEKPDGVRLPKNAGSNNVRFRPENFALEMSSSRGQFGHSFDEWGNYFLTHNQNHIYHEVIAARYLNRNPALKVARATQSVSDHGDAAEVFQITTHPDRQLFTPVGVTTASSGILSYQGGLFPPPYNKNFTLVTESVSNLVHADVLTPEGATFRASRQHPDREFLASTDSWSRPVNMYIGPDGALYVLDYYRRIIEHPEWMSDEAVEAGGLYDGQDMGRIYRITPTGTGKPDWTQGLKLGDAATAELVKQLSNPNIWWRQHAQRLLVDQKKPEAIPLLRDLASGNSAPLGKLHALWTLQGLGALTPEMIVQALKSAEPGIRINAIQLAEFHMEANPSLSKALYTLENDSDAKVRFQLLCTLGFDSSPEAARIRRNLLFRDLNDEWVQIAALSADSSQTMPLLNEVLAKYNSKEPAYKNLVKKLSEMIGVGSDGQRINQLVQQSVAPSAGEKEAAVLSGIADGLRQRNDSLSTVADRQEQLAEIVLSHRSDQIRSAALSLLKSARGLNREAISVAIEKAKAMVLAHKETVDRRRIAVGLTELADPLAEQAGFLEKLLGPGEEPEIQIAAIRILGRIPGEKTGAYVLSVWPALTTGVRDAALDLFITDKERVPLLLDAIENGKVQASALGYQRGVRLMSNPDDVLRERARKLITGDEDREKAIASYQQSLQLSGDSDMGRQLFVQHCSICHQVRGEMGVSYGPDLGTVHNWLPKDLLANIVDPALSMAPGFDNWQIELNSGETLQGMIASETASAIQLKLGPGADRTINRQEIRSIQGLTISPMPAFTSQMNPQEMADLIAFMRDSRLNPQ